MNFTDILSLISFIVVLALLFTATYVAVHFRNKSASTHQKFVQALIDKAAIENKLQEMVMDKNSKDLEKTDGFIKFISESRQWAFDYIEETQTVISNFTSVVGPVMEYYNKYGRINNNESMNIIFDEYQKLIQVLPQNENTNKENNNE